jgi:hypothetical protein
VSLFPLRDPVILISILENGSDILLSLDLKFKEQGRDVSQCDIPSIEISKW